jgi:membrane-bound serine protease (ClpP class)
MAAVGVALIIAGLLLLLAEAHVSTGGIIGAVAAITAIGGVALLLLAAGASPAAVLVVALCAATVAAALLLLLRRRIARTQRARPRTGSEALMGHVGVLRSGSGSEWRVFVDGSLWRAEAETDELHSKLHTGEKVVVEDVEGLTLRVRRAEQWELHR